jgi:hypothetical protein
MIGFDDLSGRFDSGAKYIKKPMLIAAHGATR